MVSQPRPTHISIVALPESMATPVHGLYETLMMLEAVGRNLSGDGTRLFEIEIVGPAPGILRGACGLPLDVHRAMSEVQQTDIVIVTSMFFEDEWITGRHPQTVAWLKAMHDRGASLCSACAGALLLAETGLLDGQEATTHWAFAPTFRQNFPQVRLCIEEMLVTAGPRHEFVMSGAASSWQDLILYLIARHSSPSTAMAIGKFLLYSWHEASQAPYISFMPPADHGDAVIRALQAWLHEHYAVPCPVEEMVQRSGLPESSFKRRFRNATGYSPLHYVQHLRVEEAKTLLERTAMPIDQVCLAVGYEEPAFFRRLFKRLTRITPGQYRRKFHFPFPARGVTEPVDVGGKPRHAGRPVGLP
ncbi:helix-turn-helix domain-containing protein [Halomonas sp. NO4]|uniref:GlxA family transcriptional regulator n=1 Tax=Halomonas sp. NO4 TaxID=2484813 RepID=UPI0013D64567|nr:helix-turn-helix domain-containing protein [Halomonas sp. NO4]